MGQHGPPEGLEEVAKTAEGPLDDLGVPLGQGPQHQHLQHPGQAGLDGGRYGMALPGDVWVAL